MGWPRIARITRMGPQIIRIVAHCALRAKLRALRVQEIGPRITRITLLDAFGMKWSRITRMGPQISQITRIVILCALSAKPLCTPCPGNKATDYTDLHRTV